MRRREFTFLGGIAAWSRPAAAQNSERIRQIGILTDDAENGGFAVFGRRLRELGWIEGRNLHIDVRTTENVPDSWRAHAKDLVAAAPDVIVVNGNPGVAALQDQTHTIPIVFVTVGDPVGSGFVASLGKPGGNTTGFMHFEPPIGAKWLQVLKEISPAVGRAMVLQLPESSGNGAFLRAADAAAEAVGVVITAADARNADDIERAVTSFARAPNGGVIALPFRSRQSRSSRTDWQTDGSTSSSDGFRISLHGAERRAPILWSR